MHMEWAKDSTPLDGLFPVPVPPEADEPCPPGQAPADASLAAVLSPGGRRRVYGALCLAARAAGRRTPARLRVLTDYEQRLGITPDDVRLQQALADHVRCIRMGARQHEKELTVVALIELVTADGRTTQRERELLCRVAARAGLTPGQVDELLSKALARHVRQRAPRARDPFGESDLQELEQLSGGKPASARQPRHSARPSGRQPSARHSARQGAQPGAQPSARHGVRQEARFSESDTGVIFDESLKTKRSRSRRLESAGPFDHTLLPSAPASAGCEETGPFDRTLLPGASPPWDEPRDELCDETGPFDRTLLPGPTPAATAAADGLFGESDLGPTADASATARVDDRFDEAWSAGHEEERAFDTQRDEVGDEVDDESDTGFLDDDNDDDDDDPYADRYGDEDDDEDDRAGPFDDDESDTGCIDGEEVRAAREALASNLRLMAEDEGYRTSLETPSPD